MDGISLIAEKFSNSFFAIPPGLKIPEFLPQPNPSKIRNEVSQSLGDYQQFGGGSSGPEDVQSSLEKIQQNVALSTLRGGAAFFGLKAIQDEFQYETVPALRAASTMGANYTANLSQAMQAREQYVLDLSTTITSSLQAGITAGVVGVGAVNLIRNVRSATRGLAGFRAVSTGIRAAAGFAAGTGIGLAPAAALVATELFVSFVLPRVVRFAVDRATQEKQNEVFRNTFAGSMLNASVMAEYVENTRFIPDFSFSSMRNLHERTRRLGATRADLYPIMGNVTRNISGANTIDYSAKISNVSRFYGVSSEVVGSTFQNLGNIAGGDREVNDVAREFEKFFVSVAGSVQPSISQINMVRELGDFANQYSYAQKMIMDVSVLANVQAFLGRAGLGDFQTTQTTQQLVTSIDQALMSGVTYQNASAYRFMQSYGISSEEAARGITSNNDTLNKFLGGLVSEYNLGGSINSDQKRRLAVFLNNLGLDLETIQIIFRILPSFIAGERVTGTDFSSLEARFSQQRTYDDASTLLDVIENLSIDSFRELELNYEYYPEILNILKSSSDAFRTKSLDVMSKFSNLVITSLNKIDGFYHPLNHSQKPLVKNPEMGVKSTDVIVSGTSPSKEVEVLTPPSFNRTDVTFGDDIQRSLDSLPTTGPLAKNINSIRNFVENDPNFRFVVEGARELGVDPVDLAAIIGFETVYTFSPSIRNPLSSATGLIQFIEKTASGLGTTTEELAEMSFEEQMDYVVRYLEDKGISPERSSLAELYLAVFAPSRVTDGESVIYRDPGIVSANPSLNLNNDDEITRQEIYDIFGEPKNNNYDIILEDEDDTSFFMENLKENLRQEYLRAGHVISFA